MSIKMLETRRGCPDGFAMHQYHKDCIYDLPHTLACQFLNSGWAVEVDDKASQPKAA